MLTNLAGGRTELIQQGVKTEENPQAAEEAEGGKTDINSTKRRSTLITLAGDRIAGEWNIASDRRLSLVDPNLDGWEFAEVSYKETVIP